MQRKHNFGLLWCNCAYVLFLGIMGDAVVTILSDNYGYRGYNAPCRFARRVSTLKCASVLRTKGYMGVLWLIFTGIRSRIAQKYTPPPPSSVWGMPGHKWHIHARP